MHVSPFLPAEELAGRVEALDLRAQALATQPLGPEVAREYRDLVGELHVLLHSELVEQRLFGEPATS